MLVNGFVTHVELVWDHEPAARFLERLASFARVITFDRRGSGLSDPLTDAPTLEERMDDVRAVMDAAGSERAALFGISEGVPMSILFAATYPDRVQALVCSGGLARSTAAPDYPWAVSADALAQSGAELVLPYWGQGAIVELAAPSQAENPDTRAFFARLERSSASPGMLASLAQMFLDTDVREVVASVHVPTLLLHRRHDRLVNVRHSRWLAEHMPNARLIELPGDDHSLINEDPDAALDEVQEFLTGTRYSPTPQRVLATVLFTDIVDSTRTAAELGDHRWRDVLERHQQDVRTALERAGGREIKSTGDGFLAAFDGPARAVGCARAILGASDSLGIRVRAGLHAGECEVMGEDIGGIAVQIAARVSALARPGEVLVSRTVKDLVAGSGIHFSDRGAHTLKGGPTGGTCTRWSIDVMSGLRVRVLLVSACLGAGALASAAPAQGATASVLPTKTVAVSARHSGYTTLSALALVNVYRGAVVTVSTATSTNAALESEGSVTASSSRYLNLARLVRDIRFRSGGRVLMSIAYVPPGSSGESYVKNAVVRFSSRGTTSLSATCSETFAGVTLPDCKLPCPAPAGISVNYCDGLGLVLHFHAEYPYSTTPRAVRIRSLQIDILNLGSSIAVFCAPGRGGSCPPFEVYPNLRRHHVRIRGLIGRRLTRGTQIDIVLYKGNYTGQIVRLDVVSRNPPFIKARRLCNYPDRDTPQRCTRPEG